MKLKDAADAWINHLTEFHQNPVHKSVVSRRSHMKQVLVRVPNIEMSKLTAMHFREAFYGESGWKAQGLHPRTLNTRRATLSVFFKWAAAAGIVKPGTGDRLLAMVPNQKVMDRAFVRLTPAQLFQSLELFPRPNERIFVALCIYTGLRFGEVATLRWEQVNLDDQEIATEIHKTGKRGRTGIPNELRAELDRWMPVFAADPGVAAAGGFSPDMLVIPARERPDPRIHRTEDGRQMVSPEHLPLQPYKSMSAATASALVKRILGHLGLEDNREGTHTLRRSFAYAMYVKATEDGEVRDDALLAVKELLNHSSTAQTERYIGAQRGIEKAHKLMKGRDTLSAMVIEETPDNNVIQLHREAQ